MPRHLSEKVCIYLQDYLLDASETVFSLVHFKAQTPAHRQKKLHWQIENYGIA